MTSLKNFSFHSTSVVNILINKSSNLNISIPLYYLSSNNNSIVSNFLNSNKSNLNQRSNSIKKMASPKYSLFQPPFISTKLGHIWGKRQLMMIYIAPIMLVVALLLVLRYIFPGTDLYESDQKIKITGKNVHSQGRLIYKNRNTVLALNISYQFIDDKYQLSSAYLYTNPYVGVDSLRGNIFNSAIKLSQDFLKIENIYTIGI